MTKYKMGVTLSPSKGEGGPYPPMLRRAQHDNALSLSKQNF